MHQPFPTKILSRHENKALNYALSKLCGVFIVQIGGTSHNLNTATIPHKIYVNQAAHFAEHVIQCAEEALPLVPNSIDVIVLIHALESHPNPTLVLQEIYQALRPGGTLLLLGFNPLSLWGLAKLWHQAYPFKTPWLRATTMGKLLTNIGFTTSDYQTFCFRPPCRKEKFYNRMLFLENLGHIFWPYCGASYMFSAQKTLASTIRIASPLPLTETL